MTTFPGFTLPDELRLIREQIRRFIREEIIPLEQRLDPDAPSLPEEDWERLASKTKAAGLWALAAPEEYGGGGLDTFSMSVILEEMAQHRLGRVNAGWGVFGRYPPPAIWAGSKAQIEKYAAPAIREGWRTFFAITEPSGGSDPAGAIQTRAEKRGDKWVLNGRKVFISNIDGARWGIVFARSNKEKGRGGISCFIIEPGTPGFAWKNIRTIRTAAIPNDVVFEDCVLPADALIGQEGQGLDLAFDLLVKNRFPYSATNLGVAVAAHRMAIEHAKQRETFGQKLSQRQAIQWMLADAEVELRACGGGAPRVPRGAARVGGCGGPFRGPPRERMSAAMLDGVRVVEIGQALAGPMAGEILAHLGADVIKVERPEGDDARKWGPPFWKGTSPGFLAVNANKRSIIVDLKDREAVEWLTTLIGDSDVVLQNLRPGSIDELGLGARTLTVRFPLLIYASVWAFGATGPMRLLPGYEPLLQAYSGLMMMNGDEGGPPTRVGTSILDYGTGMWAAIGILAALLRRAATGRGCIVDASLYETGLAWLKGHHASFSTSGIVPERHRTGSHRVVPFESFETSTGPIIVAAGNDRLFAKLAGVLGHPEWAADPRYTTNAERVTNKPALLAEIAKIFVTASRDEWIARLEAEGVPCAGINTLPDAATTKQADALGRA